MSTLVVTKGSRGIGAAICIAAAAADWDVVVNYCEDQRAAERVVDRVSGAGAHALAVSGGR